MGSYSAQIILGRQFADAKLHNQCETPQAFSLCFWRFGCDRPRVTFRACLRQGLPLQRIQRRGKVQPRTPCSTAAATGAIAWFTLSLRDATREQAKLADRGGQHFRATERASVKMSHVTPEPDKDGQALMWSGPDGGTIPPNPKRPRSAWILASFVRGSHQIPRHVGSPPKAEQTIRLIGLGWRTHLEILSILGIVLALTANDAS